jgi:iron complex transport system substrate-binding protein
MIVFNRCFNLTIDVRLLFIPPLPVVVHQLLGEGAPLAVGRAVALIVVALALTAAILVLAHNAAPGKEGGGTGGSRVIVDALGRHVTVPVNVSRVVAVGPGALRIVVYLGAWDRVVGVEAVEKKWGPMGRPYVMAHPELCGLPVVGPGGPGKFPDAEAIARLHPDVVFATFLDRRQADLLEKETGVPVVVLGAPVLDSVGDFGELFRALRIAGKVLGAEGRAEELIRYTRSLVWDLGNRTAGAVFNG